MKSKHKMLKDSQVPRFSFNKHPHITENLKNIASKCSDVCMAKKINLTDKRY